MKHQAPVIPALAGIRFVGLEFFARRRPMFSFWIPAFAGMTEILPCCRTKQPDGMKALHDAFTKLVPLPGRENPPALSSEH